MNPCNTMVNSLFLELEADVHPVVLRSEGGKGLQGRVRRCCGNLSDESQELVSIEHKVEF